MDKVSFTFQLSPIPYNAFIREISQTPFNRVSFRLFVISYILGSTTPRITENIKLIIKYITLTCLQILPNRVDVIISLRGEIK